VNTFLQVDTSELAKLVGALDNAAEVLNAGAANAVNRTAVKVRRDTVKQIVSQVRLDEKYVDSKVMVEQLATVSKPQAIVEVPDQAVSLARYDAQQRTKSNVWTAAKYAATFGTLAAPVRLPSGKMAQWIPRKGDRLRGIAQGQKQAGITAGVRISYTATLSYVFLMPIRDGKVLAGRWGAFSRPKGGGKPAAKYGPSAYQVTKGVWRDYYEVYAAILDGEIQEQVLAAFDRAMVNDYAARGVDTSLLAREERRM
jgi:hypothetical protein